METARLPSPILRSSRAGAAFVGLGTATFAALLWLTRDTTFMQDEWDLIQGRLDNDDDAFLHPHNNHLLALVVVLYKALWSTVGLEHYWPYRATAIALHVTCVALLFVLVRRRLGGPVALAACLPIFVLGSAWEVLVIPFNVQWYMSLAALLGIVLLLDRRTLASDLLIGLLLFVCLASSSLGPPAAFGLAVTCLLGRRWRRLAIAAIPAVLYGLWFLVYDLGASNQPPTHLTIYPGYVFRIAAGSVAALAGIPLGIEPVAARGWLVDLVHLVTVALAGGLAFQLLSRRRALTPTLVLVLTTLVTYWLVLMVSRGYTGYAYTSRYLYIGPVLLVLLAAEHFRGTKLQGRWLVAIISLSLLAAIANTTVLRHYAGERRRDAVVLRGELGGMEIARQRVPPDFRPDHDPKRAVTIVAVTYFAAIDRLGSSPAPSPAELERLPEYGRRAADRVLREVGQVQLRPLPPQARPSNGCLRVRPDPPRDSVTELLVPRAGLRLRAPPRTDPRIAVRRFASAFADLGIAPPQGSSDTLLAGATDGSSRPWRARIRAQGTMAPC